MGKSNQILISISRKYGSGGHEIGKKLSEMLGIDFIDRNMLDGMSEEFGIDIDLLRKYDEKVVNPFAYRTVQAMNTSITNNPTKMIAHAQHEYIIRQAKAGKSFVLIGRAGDEILKDYPYLDRFFITGELDYRIRRIMERREMNEKDAKAAIRRHDRSRRMYHDTYSEGRWGDADNYEMILSSSLLGVDRSAQVLYDYLKLRDII